MAEIDKGLIFGEALAVTSGTTVAPTSIPLSTARNIFQGKQLVVAILVTVAAHSSSGDETYQWDVLSDTTGAIGAPTVEISRAIGRAVLLAGSLWTIPVPLEMTQQTFLGLRAVLAGTGPTITYSAYLAPADDVVQWVAPADALTIR
ncbi:MAG TPA: hypothetical protein VG457_17305 [Planctomycetota bacterium]|jgi:hypothetical protein|nr:hypothetical protein [Planctomycetota bacterium]